MVSAFAGLRDYPAATPCLVGQGVAATSVADGDVTIGVNAARAQLEAAAGPLEPELTLATSSAAGGLRMTVHGLTQRMTAMAAREAALGRRRAWSSTRPPAACVPHDLREIDAVAARTSILLAGGVEGGDCDTVLFNAEQLGEARGAADRRVRRQLRRLQTTRRSCWSAPASGSSSPTTCIRLSTSSTSCRPAP